jgi:hypothetical protein
MLRITSDDQDFYFFLMFSYGFQSFIIIYVSVKFHGHEDTHVNSFFHIHVGG